MNSTPKIVHKLLLFKCLALFFIHNCWAQEAVSTVVGEQDDVHVVVGKKDRVVIAPKDVAPQSMLGLMPHSSAESENLFTLEDTFQRISNDNLTVLLNREGVQEALQASYMERSKLFPQLNLRARQTRNQIDNVGRGLGALGSMNFLQQIALMDYLKGLWPFLICENGQTIN